MLYHGRLIYRYIDKKILKWYKDILERRPVLSNVFFDSEGPKEGEAYPGFLIKYRRKKNIFVPGLSLEEFAHLRGGDSLANQSKEQRAGKFAKAIRGFRPSPNPLNGKTIWDSKLRPPETTGDNICFEVAEQEKHFVVERVLLQ